MVGETSSPGKAATVQQRGRRDRLFRLIALAAVVVVLSVVSIGAEFAARYRERHRTTPPDYVPSIYYPHKRLRYGLIPSLDYYGWFRINSFGFRGRDVSKQKPAGTLRIVCLGASTTFDIGSVGSNHPWPEVLEAELQLRLGTRSVEVLNLGIPGATSLDSLIDLQIRALGFQPDLLIVYQAHNDFIYSIPPARTKPSGLFPQEDPPRGRLARWLDIHSLLYAKTEGRLFDLIDRLTRLPLVDSGVETTPQDRDRAIAQGLSGYRDNLRSIVAISRANGIALALPEVIVPFAPAGAAAHDCRVCAGLPEAYAGLPLAGIRSTVSQYNEVLRQLGTEGRGVSYVPTEGFVPSADRYYHDAVHFSPDGSVRMGKSLAGALIPIIKGLNALPPSLQ